MASTAAVSKFCSTRNLENAKEFRLKPLQNLNVLQLQRSFAVHRVKLSEFEGGSGTIYADSSEVRPWKTSDARLVLEDGSIWRAKSFGATGTQVGEVVFNTSLTGYQEILTDPSYAGQFVLMTNPHNGNTGVNPDDEESSQCFLGGLIIRSLSICTSNWRCTETLGDYLAKRNIMGIYDVDTRAITSFGEFVELMKANKV
ncbi:carbamoyl-phosphate synthase small chain [Carex littledalei]|uniref:carbamoyl-phosphate synthase (glutamine-hydrolyzing) n=1 Tax=Carex littledalei TaxID=544730 RepID=A0A833R3U4_9POAL|nr:carbamoyl-phosphate synthase small chain [Carex littledalei]